MTILLSGAPVPASAAPVTVGGDIRVLEGPGTTGGGEFTIVVDETTSFLTFCLQRTEYINFVDKFHVDGISPYAVSDPVSNGGDPGLHRDDLSEWTAFLYTQFRNRTLTDYDYEGPNRSTSADYLQNAIWMFEDELEMDDNNPYVMLANRAVDNHLWEGFGEVRVLNLSFGPERVESQDQLMLVSSATTTITEVPEPASLLLFGSGMSIAAMARRRKTRQSRSK